MGNGDSKIEFKSHLNQLLDARVMSNDHEFWSVVFTTPLTQQDIVQLLTPDEVRSLRLNQPENLAIILYKSVEQLYLFSQPPNYHSESTSARNSLYLLTRIVPVIFEHDDDRFVQTLFFDNTIPSVNGNKPSTSSTADDASQQQQQQQQQQDKDKEQQPKKQQQQTEEVEKKEEEEGSKNDNDVAAAAEEAAETSSPVSAAVTVGEDDRIKVDLTDAKKDEKDDSNNVTNTEIEVKTDADESTTTTAPKQQETAEEEVETDTTSTAATAAAAAATQPEKLRLKTTLAEALITTIMRIMFTPGFTVSEPSAKQTAAAQSETATNVDKPESLNNLLLWEGGLVSPASSVTAASYDQMVNRSEVLKCFLSCMSTTLYQRTEDTTRVENRFLAIAVSRKAPLTATFFYSLLNTIINYDPTGSLPYSSVLRSDPKERLVEQCLHALSALLQYKPEHFAQQLQPEIKEVAPAAGEQKQPSPKANVYRDYVRALRLEDMEPIFKGISTLLYNIIDANNTYLPNSQHLIPFHNEVLVLTWTLLQYSKDFNVYVCRDADVSRVLIPCLYVMQQTFGDAPRFPLFQLCAFIVLQLSGNREFGVTLNRKFDLKIPLQYPAFTGTFADLLILVLHRFIAQDKGQSAKSMYDCFLTIVCNISPYCKTLSLVTSFKLVNLFEALATPKYLYTDESSPKLVHLMLEVFNNLIQYQYEGNAHIVYSILRKKKVFHDLAGRPNLDQLREYIEKRHRAQLEKHQQAQQQQPQQAQAPLLLPRPFVPTEEWINSWKSALPLYTIMTMLKTLVPEVERLCNKDLATEDDVIDYLKKTTLVGLLPVPHTIVIRTFQGNEHIDSFVITYLWGLIYLRSLGSVAPIFDAQAIRLFSISVQPRS